MNKEDIFKIGCCYEVLQVIQGIVCGQIINDQQDLVILENAKSLMQNNTNITPPEYKIIISFVDVCISILKRNFNEATIIIDIIKGKEKYRSNITNNNMINEVIYALYLESLYIQKL